jgi:adenylate cyclase class 2
VLSIELKARCADLGSVRERCEALGGEQDEADRQIDTYFSVRHGRLKLRESLRLGTELIYYARADVAGARESHYDVYAVEDAQALKAILEKTLGVRAVITKRREVFLIGGVRVHLDRVQDLGTFVELEASVDHAGDIGPVAEEVRRLKDVLGIEDRSLVKESYGDMVAAAPFPPP